MKSQKNIETLLRESEKKLTIQPSNQAWNKLERRLDVRKKKNGNIVFMRHWMAIAASLIVLVSSLYFWSATDKNSNFDYLPTIVEELGDTNDCNPYCMVLEGRKKLPEYYANPVRMDN